MSKEKILAKLELDSNGEWGTSDLTVKEKQSEPIGILPKNTLPVTSQRDLRKLF